MDTVKFLRELGRICSKYDGFDDCVGCPVRGNPICLGNYEKFSKERVERIVEIVENWSRENPEEIGKKYIIEIDGVNKDGHCHTCIGWLSKSQLEQLEEYKESEE